jgi:hypothetical protein
MKTPSTQVQGRKCSDITLSRHQLQGALAEPRRDAPLSFNIVQAALSPISRRLVLLDAIGELEVGLVDRHGACVVARS